MAGPRPDPAVLALVLSRTRELLGMGAPSMALLSQLAAAPGQVPTSAPVAPSQANQPAFGSPPQDSFSAGLDSANKSVRDLIFRLAKKYRLDPNAVMAVARGEGGLDWGAVGDGGHAFGPFQLNDAGGVITGRPGDHAAFANSPAGLDFALRKMAEAGAAGLTGPAAVEVIIRRFERPADPDSSVRNALARLTNQ